MNFKHDCDRCIYLGEYEDRDGKCDLYICPRPANDKYCPLHHTVIARFSNDGPDYMSFMVGESVVKLFEERPDYPLTRAYELAKLKGFEFVRPKVRVGLNVHGTMKLDPNPFGTVEISADVWDAYQKHCEQVAAWDEFIRNCAKYSQTDAFFDELID